MFSSRAGRGFARAALCALLFTARPAVPAPAAGALLLHDCRLEHPAGLASVAARCGQLAVPENPAEPAGRSLLLAVAVVPALDRAHALEPLFIIAGGPGQAASGFYAGYAPAFGGILRRHDLVLVDQRGTGSSARLDCQMPADLELGTPSVARLQALSAACRAALPGRPPYYTTSVAVRDLEAITGQKVVITRAKKSISNFKLREKMPIGCRVTLRSTIMYEFLDRFISVTIPRIRDFRGLSDKSFDGRGNYTIGIKEHTVFPEIDVDKITKIFGMDITFVTTATTDQESYELLKAFGMPFVKREQVLETPKAQ